MKGQPEKISLEPSSLKLTATDGRGVKVKRWWVPDNWSCDEGVNLPSLVVLVRGTNRLPPTVPQLYHPVWPPWPFQVVQVSDDAATRCNCKETEKHRCCTFNVVVVHLFHCMLPQIVGLCHCLQHSVNIRHYLATLQASVVVTWLNDRSAATATSQRLTTDQMFHFLLLSSWRPDDLYPIIEEGFVNMCAQHVLRHLLLTTVLIITFHLL